jgi:hypothetical protein
MSTESNEPAGTGEEMNIEFFKMTLKEYLKLDEETKTLSKALKQRRDKMVALNSTLLAFLNKNDINQVQLEGAYQGQELKPDKSQKVKSASAGTILDVIKAKLADKPELLEEITREIDSLKETVEVEKVKISKAKKIAPTAAAGIIRKKNKKPTLAEESAESNALLLGATTDQ